MRFTPLYARLRDTEDPLPVLRAYTDEEVIYALAAAPRREDPYLVNVLATEAMNRAQRARAITHAMGEAVIAVDRHRRVTFMNPAAEHLLGWTHADACGHRFADLAHTPHDGCVMDRAWHEKRVEQADDEKVIRNTGGTFTAQLTAAPMLRDDELVGLILVCHDVTERKRAEAELHDRYDAETALASVSRRLVAPHDLDAALQDVLADLGRLRHASRAFLCGAPPDTVLGGRIIEWCAPGVSTAKAWACALPGPGFEWTWERLTEGGVVVVEDAKRLPDVARAERETLRRHGVRSLLAVPLRSDDATAGVLVFHHVDHAHAWTEADINLLRVAGDLVGHALESARRERQLSLLAHCFEHAGDCMMLVDASGRIRYANASACTRYGYARDALKRCTVMDVNPEMTRDAWREAWQLLDEHGRMRVATRHRSRGGRTFPVDVHAVRLHFEGLDYALVTVRNAPRGSVA